MSALYRFATVPSNLIGMLVALAIAFTAGSLAAAGDGHIALCVTLATLALESGLLCLLLALGAMAGPPAPPTGTLRTDPGAYMADGPRVLHLPEVNP